MRGQKSDQRITGVEVQMISERHSQGLIEGLQNLRNINVGVDIYLCSTSGNKLPAHKTVLSAVSPYFRTLWQTGQLMGTELTLPHIDHNILVLLLDFVYTGKLLLSSQSVWNVLTAASQLELTDAPQLCRKFIDTHLNIDSTTDALLEETIETDENHSNTLMTDLVAAVKQEPAPDGIDWDDNHAGADEPEDDDEYQPPTKRTLRSRGRQRKSAVAPKQQVAKKRGRPRKSDASRKGVKAKRKSTPKSTSKKIADKNSQDITKTKTTPRTYQCDICTRSFNHRSVLSLHRKGHSKVLVNALLVKSFLQARLSKKFEHLTLDDRGQEIQCDKCSRVFPLYSKWIRHYKNQHITYIKCKNCDRTFTSSLALRQHCVRKHKDKLLTSKAQLRRFRIHCQRFNLVGKSRRMINNKKEDGVLKRQCGEMLRNREGMRSQECSENRNTDISIKKVTLSVRQGRKQKTKYKKTKTGHASTQINKLNEHENDMNSVRKRGVRGDSETNTGKRLCNLCGKVLQNNYTLKNHLSLVHRVGGKHTCPICAKVFLQHAAFNDHIDSHAGTGRHQCFKCGKTFAFRTYMIHHVKKCSGGRVFKKPQSYNCSHCGSKFTSEATMNYHIKVQHECTSYYTCDICSQTFKWRMSLYRHKKGHHTK